VTQLFAVGHYFFLVLLEILFLSLQLLPLPDHFFRISLVDLPFLFEYSVFFLQVELPLSQLFLLLFDVDLLDLDLSHQSLFLFHFELLLLNDQSLAHILNLNLLLLKFQIVHLPLILLLIILVVVYFLFLNLGFCDALQLLLVLHGFLLEFPH